MRATLFYTMLAMTILNAVDSASEVPAQLKPPAASPSITVVRADTTRLVTYVNQSELIESDASIRRVSVGNPELIEVVAVSNRELVVNAKAVGETTLLVWSAAGRKPFTIVVLPLPGKVDGVRRQFEKEFDGQDVTLSAAGRAVAIASTLGKVVNLLRVEVPLATQTISSPSSFTLSSALNVFLYRKDLNLGATIQALEAKNLVRILAEPNLLTASGSEANFLAAARNDSPERRARSQRARLFQ